MKLTDLLDQINEESSVGGGTTAGATATPGTGEQYAGKKGFKSKVPKNYKAAPSVPNRKSKAIDYKKILETEEAEAALKESYSKFKKQTNTRTPQDQFHQAIKEAKKKVGEAGKIMEYAERLKEELNGLNEGGEPLKYKKHTEGALAQIKESVVGLYKKLKSF